MIKSLIGAMINKFRYATCEGCKKGYASQRNLSCLMNDAGYFVETNFNECVNNFDNGLVKALYSYHGKIAPGYD